MKTVFICTPSWCASIEDAKKRTARGERQTWCPTCGRWRWPDECKHGRRKKP